MVCGPLTPLFLVTSIIPETLVPKNIDRTVGREAGWIAKAIGPLPCIFEATDNFGSPLSVMAWLWSLGFSHEAEVLP